ncbi:MAG: fibronectin type III domain-containing protein [Candidatus Kerfeldbacteria bacterium]|nr:fibronectin type III domain-containing protein [Candidatus Kerfeldbacteria bacterium]
MRRFVMFSLLVSLMIVVPTMAVRAHDLSFTTSPEVLSTERVGTKPVPTLITWAQSGNADDGTVMVDHFEVVVEDDNNIEMGRVTVAADQFSVEINKTNLPELKVYERYHVYIVEVHTDATEYEGYDESFYTGVPKLENLRVKNKVSELDGTVSVTLKWRKPTALNGEYVTYEYKVALKKNASSLVKESSDFGDLNSTDITGLPHKKLRVKVRGTDTNYGTGEWSAWKTFSTPAAD